MLRAITGIPAVGQLPSPARASTRTKTAAEKIPWPKSLAEQAQIVRATLATESRPLTPADLAKRFQRANSSRVTDLLETLCSLGQAHRTKDGRYAK